MAYFSNSSEGSYLDEQCDKCIFGKLPCPIFYVQIEHNYSACNNQEASKILNELINNNGECSMYKRFKNVLSKEINGSYPDTKMQLKILQLDKLKKLCQLD